MGVITSTSAAVAIVIKLINKKITKPLKTTKCLKCQCRFSITDTLSDRYCFKKSKAEGHVSNYSMAALESLLKSYKAMGGNGFVESEMEEIRKINQERRK